jgi:Fe-S-cluster-containing hydrogenase component 2
MSTLKDYLNCNKTFKLICGAGNEDCLQIEKLVAVYSKAGANMFDLSSNTNSVQAYFNAQDRFNKRENNYFGISVGTDDDEHFKKAKINPEKCLSCGICRTVCLQNAVVFENNSYQILEQNCIGCMECSNVCMLGAVEKYRKKHDFEKNFCSILDFCTPNFIELHCSSPDIDETLSKWQFLNDSFDGILSICVSRKYFDDSELLELLQNLLSCRKPFKTIIQADGISMSGRYDNAENSLSAMSLAKLLQENNLPAYIFISGGVNLKSALQAKDLGIKVDGYALGTYARMIVKDCVEQDDFWENPIIFNSAVEKAAELVNTLIHQ